MALTSNGKIRYQLNTPYQDGTTPVIFEPLDFIARLAALLPKPRVNLTRFHGVFAPNSKHQIQVIPGKRGKGSQLHRNEHLAGKDSGRVASQHELDAATEASFRFRSERGPIETCERCGGKVKVIASIEDPVVIAHILKHLQQEEAFKADIQPHKLPLERGPPVMRLFD